MFLALSSAAPATSYAGNEVSAQQIDQAEYMRLSQEVAKLAKRNLWAGVERNYRACVETGAPLSFEDHRAGAHAAAALGDVASAKERLRAAATLREDPEILNAMWEIDSEYGRVLFAGDLGDVSLMVESMPFNPTQAKAVQFAIAEVEEHGLFEGLLPKGRYTFAEKTYEIQPRVSNIRVDLRSDESLRKIKKEQKRRKREQRKGVDKDS
jgi:hypothetical protein